MTNGQASIITAGATVIQASTAIIMLIVACITTYLAKQQSKSMQIQINLNLYEKRFKIYNSLNILITSVLKVPLPKDELEVQKFIDQIGNCLHIFGRDSAEKIFLIDDELKIYINYIENEVKKYCSVVANKAPSESGAECIYWLDEVTIKKQHLLSLLDEVPKKFKKCLDFKKINNKTN